MHGEIRHRIERTRNKHSRAVYRDDTIVIRLARNLSSREEREHIEHLLGRMVGKVREERRRVSIDPFRPLLEGDSALELHLANGTGYLFTLSAGERTKATRTADGWHVQVGPQVRRKPLHRFLWTLLGELELPHILRMTEEINRDTLRVRIGRVRLSYAASQWGSCSCRGDIMLSALLLFLPEELLRYVIIHELAHRIERSHSDGYWRIVSGVLPGWRELRTVLLKYRICSL